MRLKTAVNCVGCMLVVATLAGCVDTDNRPDEPFAADRMDPGSGPYDCGLDDPDKYELLMFDDFETGAAAGTWYANNELCENCPPMADARNCVDKALEGAVDPGALPVDAGTGDVVDFAAMETDDLLAEEKALQEAFDEKADDLLSAYRDIIANMPDKCDGDCDFAKTLSVSDCETLAAARDYLAEEIVDDPVEDDGEADGEGEDEDEDESTAVDEEKIAALYSLASIADNILAAYFEIARRSFTACRDQCRASQNLNIFDKPLPADRIADGGRCGESRYGMHLTVDDLIDWGANVGTPLLSPFDDAAEWEGVAFWARRAPHSRGILRIEVADTQTDGTYITASGEPPCSYDASQDEIFEGCDRFGGYVQVGPSWNFFTLPFDSLAQAGWGKSADSLRIGELRSITFLFGAGTWDVWIDDVAYYKRRSN